MKIEVKNFAGKESELVIVFLNNSNTECDISHLIINLIDKVSNNDERDNILVQILD